MASKTVTHEELKARGEALGFKLCVENEAGFRAIEDDELLELADALTPDAPLTYADRTSDDDPPPKYTLLRNPDRSAGYTVADAIFSLKHLGEALEVADDINKLHGLAGALKIVGALLENARRR